MEKNNDKIIPTIFLLSVINALLIPVVLLIIHSVFGLTNFAALALLIAFATFILSFLMCYVFYFYKISKVIDNLANKISNKFLSNEIPKRVNQLEEHDSIKNLEEKVDHLIESRQYELEQFENLDSYRKEYLGNVSHELKTPVFNIQGYIDTLLNGGLEDSAINIDFLKKAEKSIDRLIHIIDDLETITQLETGELHLEIDDFDIVGLCRDVYSALELIASKKGIKLELAKRYEKPIYVIGDKFRIRQVLVNLITNSLKYGKENGKTLITIDYLKDDIVIKVKDNGVGIASNHLPRLFERFYRVDKGRSREQGGTGLGLAIVKHILEAHKKSIIVESKIGEGSVFTFSLEAASN